MFEQDCRSCKDWRTCMGKIRTCPKCGGKKVNQYEVCDECQGTGYIKEGYLFAHLRFCPFQILWILANSDYLHSGKWPPQYTVFEEPRKHQVNEEGYFVKPAIIIAEVEKRLGTTPTSLSSFPEGKLLYAQAKAGETLETIDDDAWLALMYVKGKDRKIISFLEWKRHYRKNGM